jgi:hypothetical protein
MTAEEISIRIAATTSWPESGRRVSSGNNRYHRATIDGLEVAPAHPVTRARGSPGLAKSQKMPHTSRPMSTYAFSRRENLRKPSCLRSSMMAMTRRPRSAEDGV